MSVTNVHKGIPQHRRRPFDFSLLILESEAPSRELPADGHFDIRSFGVPDRAGVS